MAVYPRSSRCRRFCHRKATGRSGAAAVEMAVMLPFFILLVLGLIEFGRALMVHQALVNGAREGGRYAASPIATPKDLANKTADYLTSAGISGFTIEAKINGTTVLTMADGDSAPTGSFAPVTNDEITLTVSVPYTNVSLGFAYLIASGRTFSASVVTRKE